MDFNTYTWKEKSNEQWFDELISPKIVKLTVSIDTSTPALRETKFATTATMLTCAGVFSTTNDISSTLKSSTFNQTSGGLLILNGSSVVQIDALTIQFFFFL